MTPKRFESSIDGSPIAASHEHNRVLGPSDSLAPIGWACVLSGLVAGTYFGSPKSELFLSFAVLAGIWLFALARAQMRAVDWCMLLVGVYEVPALLFSQYRANGVSTTRSIALGVLLYFAVRLTIRMRIQVAFLGGVFGLGGAGLATLALFQFAHNSRHLSDAGLNNLLAFRSRLVSPPPPWIPGEWFTLILLALPFACASPVYLWRSARNWLAAVSLIPVLLIASALTLSLSRAVFSSTCLFFVAACSLMFLFRVVRFRVVGWLLGLALGALFLILAIETVAYTGVLEAYSGRHTSQVRSTQGRVAIWNRSIELVRAHPVWGVGSGNAALALTSTADLEETTGFASRTFSLPIQILVEKGVAGFLVYCAFLFFVAREFVRNMSYSPPEVAAVLADRRRKGGTTGISAHIQTRNADLSVRKVMVCCFAAGLIAVLFRELTYSSLFEHDLTLALAAMLSALLCLPVRDE
jgi:O-antigen ligase